MRVCGNCKHWDAPELENNFLIGGDKVMCATCLNDGAIGQPIECVKYDNELCVESNTRAEIAIITGQNFSCIHWTPQK